MSSDLPGVLLGVGALSGAEVKAILIGICALIALGFGWAALRRFRLRANLSTMPTTAIGGAFVGDIEVQGQVVSARPVTGYLSNLPCARYSWEVSEHWTRTRVVTRRDAKGNMTTHVVTDHGEDVIASGGDSTTLEVDDGTGRIRVQWDGAKLEQLVLYGCDASEGEELYYAKGPQGSVPGSDGVRSFRESGIPLGTLLYVVGYARERTDAVAVEIAGGGLAGTATEGAKARQFLISVRGEAAVTRGHATAGCIYWILGLLAAGATILTELSDRQPRLDHYPWIATAAVGGYLLISAGLWTTSTLNELIDVRNRVRRASSNIDVQLKRRADLIRNLVECVTGLKGHERGIQEAVATLRAQATVESRGAGRRPEAVLPICTVLAENYPALTAGAAFLKLQHALSDSEARIALARDEFNGTAKGYNSRISQFPARFIAQAARMGPARFFEAESFARAVPTV